jgi:hypothetical protein
MCVKVCLYVFTNTVTLKKFEVISDKNSVDRCRIIYFNFTSFPNVTNLPMYVCNTNTNGARGSAVVEALRYKPEGRGIDFR